MQAFPPPPPFYRSLEHDAGGSEGGRPVPPLPPPPIDGEYQFFGELYTVRALPEGKFAVCTAPTVNIQADVA